MQLCIQQTQRNHEGETARGKKRNSTAEIVRPRFARGGVISPQNYTSRPAAFMFEDFLFARVVSSSRVAQVTVTLLQVSQYSLHQCLLLSPLCSPACDLKNNQLVSCRLPSATFLRTEGQRCERRIKALPRCQSIPDLNYPSLRYRSAVRPSVSDFQRKSRAQSSR